MLGDLGSDVWRPAVGAEASLLNIHDYTGADVSVQDRDGKRAVIIGKAVNAVKQDFVRDLVLAQGGFSRAIENG